MKQTQMKKYKEVGSSLLKKKNCLKLSKIVIIM